MSKVNDRRKAKKAKNDKKKLLTLLVLSSVAVAIFIKNYDWDYDRKLKEARAGKLHQSKQSTNTGQTTVKQGEAPIEQPRQKNKLPSASEYNKHFYDTNKSGGVTSFTKKGTTRLKGVASEVDSMTNSKVYQDIPEPASISEELSKQINSSVNNIKSKMGKVTEGLSSPESYEEIRSDPSSQIIGHNYYTGKNDYVPGEKRPSEKGTEDKSFIGNLIDAETDLRKTTKGGGGSSNEDLQNLPQISENELIELRNLREENKRLRQIISNNILAHAEGVLALNSPEETIRAVEKRFFDLKPHEISARSEELENALTIYTFRYPSAYQVNNMLGIVYYDQGRYKEAVENFNHVEKNARHLGNYYDSLLLSALAKSILGDPSTTQTIEKMFLINKNLTLKFLYDKQNKRVRAYAPAAILAEGR